MTLDNMTGITKGSCTVDDMFCKSQLITCNRVKECNGVCPFEDALKHADKEIDEQTVIDHDRDWIIGCLEHDGFIHTHRFDKANQIIHDALSVDADKLVRCEDCRHRNTWDNPRFEPQYYKCGRGVKFRDYGYVREDDYCPLGERREE